MAAKTNHTQKSNITLRLDRDLLRDIRILAAEEDTPISALVSDRLHQAVNHKKLHSVGKMKSLARIKRGYDLGFTRPASRGERHERRFSWIPVLVYAYDRAAGLKHDMAL